MTANLPSDTTLRDEHNVVEYSSSGTGEHVLVEAVRFLLNQLRLCRAIYRRDETTVLFFGTTSYVLPVLFSRLIGKAVVVLPRGDVPLSLRLRWEESLPDPLPRVLAGLVSLLERVNYRLADAVVTYTPAMAEQLGLGRYREKLHTNGARFVDTEQFDVRVPFDEREQVVGFIGRLDVEKRVPELAAAARQLPDDIRFVFVGDGDYREMLERELAEEIECGKVEVVGWVDREEVPEQLNRMRLQVVPSHPTEGLPTAILEGMACGTPAYATPVSGVPDVVREGETGFLIDGVEESELTADITSILERDDLDQISRNGRALVLDEYSFEAAVKRYRTILTEID
ncbi:glycosyltransferase family 4 protein [Halobellus marinus]|uniref:glycosyltransferase family 4 protein n=1 Tax=Halobellus marinus TaxID=3075123 RepID=UPI0028B0E770|nr:glycosyltransferase family 4 protein [Halobellus sp. DFY28]